MPRTDTSKSWGTNRTSFHASHRYQQIVEKTVHHFIRRTDTSKSEATNRTSLNASQIPANHGQKIVHLFMQQIKSNKSYIFFPHTDTSKTSATNSTFFHASQRHQQIIGNKSYIFSCLAHQQIMGNKSYILSASRRYQQIIGNKVDILSCLVGKQFVRLVIPRTNTSKSWATNRTSCHASDTSKSWATNRTCFRPRTHVFMRRTHTRKLWAATDRTFFMPCTNASKLATHRPFFHASHRHQQIIGNKSYQKQQIGHLFHASHRCQQIIGNKSPRTDTSKLWATKSYIFIAQMPANQRQQIVRSSHPSHKYQANQLYIFSCLRTDTSKSQAN